MPRQQEPSPGDDRSEAIALPFSPDSVRQVLQWGLASRCSIYARRYRYMV